MSEGIKLFVDDHRPCPEGWELARTITEAIRVLSTGVVGEISLDHDICYNNTMLMELAEETYMPVAEYLALMMQLFRRDPQVVVPPLVFFHTGNVAAGKRMAEVIGIPFVEKNYPKDF